MPIVQNSFNLTKEPTKINKKNKEEPTSRDYLLILEIRHQRV